MWLKVPRRPLPLRQGGHYVAYVRGADRRWYLCDDAWVVGVEESVVKSVQVCWVSCLVPFIICVRKPSRDGRAV